MDTTEKLVRRFLVSQGFEDIKYEPDGNVPPDFLVNGKIAVEARRLNQNYFGKGKPQGLEEIEIPLWQKVKKFLPSFGPPVAGESWFVFIRFGRPMMPWATIEPKLRSALERFLHQTERRDSTIFNEFGFEVDLCRASRSHHQLFLMGGSSDAESGGLILAEMEKNVQHCADEKFGKIAPYRSKHAVWWLALVDYIGHGLDDFDAAMFREQASIQHTWDRILIINPRDPTKHFTI